MIGPTKVHDVCIVGAGPAGATAAWYLAGAGRSVLLLEKAAFPRDKVCGDAICANAQKHLRRMGVLEQILDRNQGLWISSGGFVSPAGRRCIGDATSLTNGALVIAIERIILDEYVARAAQANGAHLLEHSPVRAVEFSKADQLWSVNCDQQTHHARLLVLADGAQSALARSLGLVRTAPEAICSRGAIRAPNADSREHGVMYYPEHLLPGYIALLRHVDGLLHCSTYILPGGRAVPTDLKDLHHRLLREDPQVSRAVGPGAEILRMQGAWLRLGGVRPSYFDHLLLVGDAAGQIDPLTGEGIQYAMDAAELAAQTLDDALAANNLTAAFLRRYEDRWMRAFGRDFYWSKKIADLQTRYPWLLEAGAALIERQGLPFLAHYGEIMTGLRPKSDFLKPRMAWPTLRELIYQTVNRWRQAKSAQPA